MVKYFFLSILTCFVGLGIYLYFHLGITRPVEIRIETIGPLHFVYTQHTGAYHQINSDISRVEAWAKQTQINCRQTYGEFLDDPKAVDQDRLRSRVGCVLDFLPETKPKEFLTETRAPKSYVVATYRGSPAVSPFTVYPKVEEFLAEQRLRSTAPVIEIYRVLDDTSVETRYLFPIE